MKTILQSLLVALVTISFIGCDGGGGDVTPAVAPTNNDNSSNTSNNNTESNSDEITNTLPSSISLVDITAGSFTMGGTTVANDSPLVNVTLSAYKISQKEITNDQYIIFLNSALKSGYVNVSANQTRNDPCGSYSADLVTGTASSPYSGLTFIELTNYGGCTSDGKAEDIQNRTYIEYDQAQNQFVLADNTKSDWPVNWITWYGASAFASFYSVSLPTEAQWEYAARAYQDLQYSTADGNISLTQANYNGDTPGVYNPTGHVVETGSYASNPLGLFDMSGNVWEWCEDYYDSNFYQDGVSDPLNKTTSSDSKRVRRGGSWNYHKTTLLTYARASDLPTRGNNHFGFRIVVNK
jgi:sulfatase modifying factor 1